jgi:hypothetical protein
MKSWEVSGGGGGIKLYLICDTDLETQVIALCVVRRPLVIFLEKKWMNRQVWVWISLLVRIVIALNDGDLCCICLE